MDGVTLSSLSEYDFRQRTSLQCGGNLYAHLDIWKTGACFSSYCKDILMTTISSLF